MEMEGRGRVKRIQGCRGGDNVVGGCMEDGGVVAQADGESLVIERARSGVTAGSRLLQL